MKFFIVCYDIGYPYFALDEDGTPLCFDSLEEAAHFGNEELCHSEWEIYQHGYQHK